MVQTQFDKTVKVVRSDNGSEFLSRRFTQLLESLRILHQKSCVYTPQHNGIVERRHITLLDSARALMFNSSVPSKFWPNSIMAATWMINRLPSRVMD